MVRPRKWENWPRIGSNLDTESDARSELIHWSKSGYGGSKGSG